MGSPEVDPYGLSDLVGQASQAPALAWREKGFGNDPVPLGQGAAAKVCRGRAPRKVLGPESLVPGPWSECALWSGLALVLGL